jgi:hypothetical protein
MVRKENRVKLNGRYIVPKDADSKKKWDWEFTEESVAIDEDCVVLDAEGIAEVTMPKRGKSKLYLFPPENYPGIDALLALGGGEVIQIQLTIRKDDHAVSVGLMGALLAREDVKVVRFAMVVKPRGKAARPVRPWLRSGREDGEVAKETWLAFAGGKNRAAGFAQCFFQAEFEAPELSWEKEERARKLMETAKPLAELKWPSPMVPEVWPLWEEVPYPFQLLEVTGEVVFQPWLRVVREGRVSDKTRLGTKVVLRDLVDWKELGRLEGFGQGEITPGFDEPPLAEGELFFVAAPGVVPVGWSEGRPLIYRVSMLRA